MSFALCEESEEGTMDLAKRTFVQEELEALFKFIPSTKLLSFRQLSKEWDEAAKIVLKNRRDIKLLLTTDNFDGRFNWRFFLFQIDSQENVFVAPVLHIQNTKKSEQKAEEGKTCISFEIIEEICKRLGNRGIIRKLIIEDGKNSYFTSDFVLTLLGHLPSLETLEILELLFSTVMTSEQNIRKFQLPSLKQIKFEYTYMADVKEAAKFFKLILESSPNLENITGIYWYMGDFGMLPMLRDTERLSKIKDVLLTKPEDLDILFQCKPKIVLHSFTINISSEDIDSKKLFTFLQQQAVNLKSFKFDGHISVDKPIFTLPFLPVLETLNFKSWRSGCFLSVNYGRQTPALKTLKIFSYKEKYPCWEEFISYEISSERPPCRSLKELNLSIRGPTTQKMFGNFRNLFPNVKKLIVDNPEEFDFDQANKCWPNLEELKLRIHTGWYKHDFDYKDLDEIVFGINPSPDYWREKNQKKKKIDFSDKDWWMKISEPEIKKTVVKLKNLQKLEVSVEGFYGGFYLTDFAVYFGLRHMLNLKEIDISTDYDGPEVRVDVPTEAFNFLVKNLPKLEKLCLGEQNWKRGEVLK